MADTDGYKKGSKLPLSTMVLIIVSFLLVTGFILLLIYPRYNKLKDVQQETIGASYELVKQRKLYPIYTKALHLAKKTFTPKFSFPEREGIKRSRISELSTIFGVIASKCGMEFSGNSIDIGSITKESGSVSMKLSLTGNLFDFRKYLINIIELPFCDGIEKIAINSGEVVKTCYLTVRINIKKN